MPRHFNTAGPCDPRFHYMLPPLRRIPGLRALIDEQAYFVVHAPRQVGKTTAMRALARELTEGDEYAALYSSCESGQAAGGDVGEAIPVILEALSRSARSSLPVELRPPERDPSVPAGAALSELLTRWSKECPRPVVLFLDEIDALLDSSLISALRQLREGYADRPGAYPHSVGLIGLRDVRDYKIRMRPERDSLGTASPFNVKVESITLRNFTEQEVAELYRQHTDETGQVFADQALAHAFALSQGQPWLVNALAREVTKRLLPDPTQAVEVHHIDRAKDRLIERRDTHLDSLIDRLREPRVQRVIEPILAGQIVLGDRIDDDAAFVEDLGLISRAEGGSLQIANPIYQEVIPRALGFGVQQTVPNMQAWYVRDDGTLDFHKLLSAFVEFWTEHREALLRHQAYPEAAPQLVLMAFLQRVINSGGLIDREYAVGSGRIDLLVRWPHPGGLQREAVELKVWRPKKKDPLDQGLEQLSAYLERLGLDHGALVIFDRRVDEPEVSDETIEHLGRTIRLLRL